MNIILLGATGLVGRAYLNQLLADENNNILYVGRRPVTQVSIDNPRFQYVASDLESIQSLQDIYSDFIGSLADSSSGVQLVCCLGTTIKQAGSKSAFSKVDYQYVLNSATAAHKVGIEKMMVISAIGVSSKSSVFYSQVKGQMEDGLKELNFKQLIIIKPSLLMGKRDKFRLAESFSEPLMRAIKPIMQGGLKKYRAIDAEDVASCMLKQGESMKNQQGVINVFPADY